VQRTTPGTFKSIGRLAAVEDNCVSGGGGSGGRGVGILLFYG